MKKRIYYCIQTNIFDKDPYTSSVAHKSTVSYYRCKMIALWKEEFTTECKYTFIITQYIQFHTKTLKLFFSNGIFETGEYNFRQIAERISMKF